jgi:DNA-binding NarL/FixJ family response regulator
MNLLLVDDHPLFSAGLATALRHVHADSSHSMRSEPLQLEMATALQEGLTVAESFAPDMVLLDYHMSGSTGLQVLQAFADKFPCIARVVISGDERPEVVAEARAHGASGFISKTLSIDQVWRAIQAIAAGAEWWVQSSTAQLRPGSNRLSENEGVLHQSAAAPKHSAQSFTLRQLEVLRLLNSGLSNREIARTLFISERTVKQHMSDMLMKSAVANRVQLLNAVRSQGLLM